MERPTTQDGAVPAPSGAVHTVLIAEDEQLMRHALSIFLRGASDLQVVEMVENGAEAVAAAARLRPDVVLMDIHMPVMSGIEATRLITTEHPDVAVIALTTLGSVDAAVPMLRAGARGYLLKDCDPQTLIDAIRQVLGGEPALSASVTMSLLRAVADGDPTTGPSAYGGPSEDAPALGEADLAVLRLLAGGLNTAEMAAELVIAETTVKSRIAKLCSRFGVDGRVRLLIRATELGLVQPRLGRD